MKTMKKRMLIIIPAILILLAAVLIPTAVALEGETPTPTLSIDMMNLQFNENVQILYAVNLSNVNPNAVSSKDFGMLYWTSPSDSYVLDNEDKNLPTSGSMMIGETLYWIFEYRDLAAKQMTDDIYARAFLRVGDEIYYSDVQKYSVLQYAYNKLSSNTTDANLKALLGDMLSYGASAQTYFDYKTDRLATADFYRITVECGSLSDGTTNGLYLSGETVILSAPETNANGDPFSHWVNSAMETVATERTCTLSVGEANETYTAVYSVVPKYLITVEGGVLTSDNESTSGYFREGETVEFTAPEEITVTTDAGEETVNFSHWENAAEEIIAETLTHTVTVGTTDATYTAVYDTPDSYFIFTERSDGYSIKAANVSSLPSKLIIPSSYQDQNVTYIPKKAFSDGAFTYLKIPDFVTSIGESAFERCFKLKDIQFGIGIEHITDYAFRYCRALTSIELPENLYAIYYGAFWECSALRNVHIPSSLKSIQDYGFYGCDALENIYITDIESWCKIRFGYYEEAIWANPLQLGDYLYVGDKLVTTITIPNTVTRIPRYAFACKNLINIQIPKTVTTIEQKAFYYCDSLTAVYYTGTSEEWSAITIKDYNDPLTSATVYFYSETEPTIKEDGTGYDGNYWHYDENGKSAIWTLPTYSQGLEFTSNGDGTCYVSGIGTCTDTNILIPPQSPTGDTVTAIGKFSFNSCFTLVNITIPNGVTEIQNNAFQYCTKLKSIKIPESIITIGMHSFQYCYSLQIVEFGENSNLNTIEGYAFRECTNLTKITIPKNTVYIGGYVFKGCTNLVYAIVPGSVRTMSHPFDDCNNFTSLYYSGTTQEWRTLKDFSYDLTYLTATVYFYSEAEPPLNADGTAYDGYYWYYDENGEPAIWTLTATE